MPAVEVGRGEQQPGDELAGRGRVDGDLAAARPGRCRARSAAGPPAGRRRSARPASRSAVDQRAQRAVAGVRVAVEGDRARRPAPATGGRKRITVPARPTSTWAGPRSGRGRTTQRVVVHCGHVRAHAPAGRRPSARCRGRAAGARRVLDPTDDGARAPARGRSSTSIRAAARSSATGPVGGRGGPGRGGGRGQVRSRPTVCRPAGLTESARPPFCRSASGDGAGRRRDTVAACAGGMRRRAVRPTSARSSTRTTRPTTRWSPTTTSRRPTRCRSCGCPQRAAGRVLTRRPVGPGAAVGADDPRAAARMINARAETVATSPAFAPVVRPAPLPGAGRRLVRVGALRRRRRKQPYYMTRAGRPCWRSPASGRCGAAPSRLLTLQHRHHCRRVGDLAAVHDRMPLVLPPTRWDDWLRRRRDAALLAPAAGRVRSPASRSARSAPAVGRRPQRRPGLIDRAGGSLRHPPRCVRPWTRRHRRSFERSVRLFRRIHRHEFWRVHSIPLVCSLESAVKHSARHGAVRHDGDTRRRQRACSRSLPCRHAGMERPTGEVGG